MPLFENVALFGVGLIGGSLALDAKRKGLFGHVTACSRRAETLDAALQKGIADKTTLDPIECAKGADLVVLAAPVSSMEPIAKAIAPALERNTIVTDVGSVKGQIVEKIERAIPYPSRFVPGHPVAGRERFGTEAAVEGLFAGKRCVLTPTKTTDKEALRAVRALWEGVGMKVLEMDPQRHDRVLAATSHLPHLVAYALVEAVMRARETDPDILDFTAGGFHDFTRIAASSPDMWRDIFLMNSSHLDEMIDVFSSALDELKKVIGSHDGIELQKKLEEIRRVKDQIENMRQVIVKFENSR